MHQAYSDRLQAGIIEFCRFARTNGLSAGIQQTLAALEAARTIGTTDRQGFEFALRAVLCSSEEEWRLFNQLFEAFWNPSQNRVERSRRAVKEQSETTGETQPADSLWLAGQSRNQASSEEGQGKAISGASAQERLKKVDFSDVSQNDLALLEKISLRLLRQMGQRLSRRPKIKDVPGRIDLRRTIRRNISHGGDPIVLAYKAKKPRKSRLVIFLDVSGSMNLYSLFLVKFAYALQKHFKRVNTFLFSTSVVEITDALRARRLPEALQALSQRAAGWSGGTKIGESLGEFNRVYGRKLLSRDTFFMILSDGWDTGDPEVLVAELRTAKRRVRRVLWLNPLLGLPDYQPITRSMSAALPHIDVFAPAHNLESLLALERRL